MYEYKFFYRYVLVKPNGFYFNNEALGGQVGYLYIDADKKNIVLKPVSFFNPEGGVAEIVGITTINTRGIIFDGEPSLILNNIPHGTVRPGTIMMYVGGYEPPGWFFCNGKSISKTKYSNLFSIIGYTFTNSNVRDNSTLFTLPDFRYRVVKQLDTTIPSGNTAYGAVNNRGGKHEHVLLNNQLPDHLHDGTTPSHSISHTHSYTTDSTESGRFGPIPGPPYDISVDAYSGTGGGYATGAAPFASASFTHNHPVTSASTAVYSNTLDVSTNAPFSIVQPSQSISYIIRY